MSVREQALLYVLTYALTAGPYFALCFYFVYDPNQRWWKSALFWLYAILLIIFLTLYPDSQRFGTPWK